MLSRFVVGCLLAGAVALTACSPAPDDQVDGKAATPPVVPAATADSQRPIQPAPDLDLASKGDGGNPGRSAGLAAGLGVFEVSFASDGFAKACATAKTTAPEFLEFVRLTPMASRIQINLRDGQLCIENLESGRDYDFQLLAGAPFEPKAGQVVKTRAILSNDDRSARHRDIA